MSTWTTTTTTTTAPRLPCMRSVHKLATNRYALVAYVALLAPLLTPGEAIAANLCASRRRAALLPDVVAETVWHHERRAVQDTRSAREHSAEQRVKRARLEHWSVMLWWDVSRLIRSRASGVCVEAQP
ncbi:MAG: hypothetical protein AAGI01_06825 [Myxococcota bacterium]